MTSPVTRIQAAQEAAILRVLQGLVLAALFVLVPARAEGTPKPVFVHYMPWFVAKPYSPAWGHHWTMDACDPDQVAESGRRQIAAHAYPAIGPYDSADPAVLEYHVLLMKLAGIDGVVIDWYGCDDVHDYAVNEQRTQAIRDAARRAGLQYCLCYEDRTIQAAIDTGFITPEAALAQGQRAIRYAQSNYFNDGAYFRLEDGRPVLLNFGPQYFRTARQWTALFSALDPTNQPALFTLNSRLSAGEGAFNWPPMHLSELSDGVLAPHALADYLDTFEREAAQWPAFISSAFPRFHDFYQQAGLHPSYGYLDDAGGATFRSTLSRAMTNGSVMVQLVTWNDFGEGTAIEPTAEYGQRDLGVLQELRRELLDPEFSHGTNDLVLATRFYRLRCQLADDAGHSADLDRVFANIATGELDLAAAQLKEIEVACQARVGAQGGSRGPAVQSVTSRVRRATSSVDQPGREALVRAGAIP